MARDLSELLVRPIVPSLIIAATIVVVSLVLAAIVPDEWAHRVDTAVSTASILYLLILVVVFFCVVLLYPTTSRIIWFIIAVALGGVAGSFLNLSIEFDIAAGNLLKVQRLPDSENLWGVLGIALVMILSLPLLWFKALSDGEDWADRVLARFLR